MLSCCHFLLLTLSEYRYGNRGGRLSWYERWVARQILITNLLNCLDVQRRLNDGPSGRSPAEIVGSNPTGGMDVCLL